MPNDGRNVATRLNSLGIKRLALLSLAIFFAIVALFVILSSFTASSKPQEALAVSSQGQSGIDVLLVMSYDESEANTPLARNGVLDVMNRADVGVDVVYMDAYHAPIYSDAYNTWLSQMRQKVAQHGAYDAVICCDDEALYFIELNHDSLFASTPVVFFGINNIEHAMSAAKNGYATGMIEQSYMGSIMEATYNMHPTATSFTAIVDQTPAGVGNKAQFDSAVREYNDMAVRYVNASNLTRNELAASVASANPDTIVFLLDANNDRYGNVYALDDSVNLVATASKVPVYRATSGGVGDGIAGSSYLDAEADGRKAAEIAIDVLNGTKPSTIPLNVDGTLGYFFDGQVLSDYGISTLNMPWGSTVVNRQLFSFDTLRMLIVPVILLLIALFLFVKYRKTSAMETVGVATGAGAAVAAEPVEADKPDVEEDTNIVEAVAVEEKPTKTIDPSARIPRKQQLAKDHKRRGTKRGHKRQLRKTHSIASDQSDSVPTAVEEFVVPGEVEEIVEAEILADEPIIAEAEAVIEEAFSAESEVKDALKMQSDEAEAEEAVIEAADEPVDVEADERLAETAFEAEQPERELAEADVEVKDTPAVEETIEAGEAQTVDEPAEAEVIVDQQESADALVEPDLEPEVLAAEVEVVEDDIDEELCARITKVLQQAIDQDGFVVYYQPQIGLEKNQVVGYEALARLKDKSYEPAEFIPVAEKSGLIVDIDRIVTKRAVEQLAIWKRRKQRVRPISINLSPEHLMKDDDFPGYLQDLLETNDVSSKLIKIEVTEALFNGENETKAEEMAERLFDAGVSIALDNFGVGYSSFTDIMSIPASTIKIDKKFVDTFLIDGNSQNFEQLVRLAHGLGRKVVVIGVDQKWQIDVCRGLDCDIVQGFYFSKPLLPENAVQFRPRG